MTSSVKVAAHCASNKEVVVTVTNGDAVVETQILQDGESTEIMIYDNRAVSSSERLKEEAAKVAQDEPVDPEVGVPASLLK